MHVLSYINFYVNTILVDCRYCKEYLFLKFLGKLWFTIIYRIPKIILYNVCFCIEGFVKIYWFNLIIHINRFKMISRVNIIMYILLYVLSKLDLWFFSLFGLYNTMNLSKNKNKFMYKNFLTIIFIQQIFTIRP